MNITPTEKAKELILKFLRVEDDTTFYWEPYFDRQYLDDEVLPHAKSCAMIACDEMLNFQELMFGQDKDSTLFILAVKEAIDCF